MAFDRLVDTKVNTYSPCLFSFFFFLFFSSALARYLSFMFLPTLPLLLVARASPMVAVVPVALRLTHHSLWWFKSRPSNRMRLALEHRQAGLILSPASHHNQPKERGAKDSRAGTKRKATVGYLGDSSSEWAGRWFETWGDYLFLFGERPFLRSPTCTLRGPPSPL